MRQVFIEAFPVFNQELQPFNMRASIVVVILSLLFSVCLADFAFSTFTQADVDNDFSIVSNTEFDAASNSLQIVRK